MKAYSLTLVPMSWGFGRWNVRKKTLWALGPLRFVLHRGLNGKYGEKSS